jgi:hypothetical protein
MPFSMHTHFRTDTISFANSFLLPILVAGVLSFDLFEGDVVSDYNGNGVLYPIELVFNAEYPSQSHALSVSDDIPDVDVVESDIIPSLFYAACFGSTLFAPQNTGQLNTRQVYSSYSHTTSFNIPHQNSDEDEPLILRVDVA